VQYHRASSFDRTYRRLIPAVKFAAEKTIARFIHSLEVNQIPEGVGLKKLREDFWEIRVGLSIRVLLKWESEQIRFIIIGTHQDIQNYLRRL